MGYAVLAILIFIVIAVIIIAVTSGTSDSSSTGKNAPWIFEAPEKRAGRRGEYAATNAIKSVLREGDYLFTNISLSYNDKPTELDNVVVNKYGVFIIEAKTYKGRLYGTEDDYEWIKYKDDGYGNTFKKKVKNPIKQVKRQVYILAKHLEYYGERTWVEGYTILVKGVSPVESGYILENTADIDKAIHTPGRRLLPKQKVEAIKKILSDT